MQKFPGLDVERPAIAAKIHAS